MYFVNSPLIPESLSLADPGATMTFVAGGALKPIGGHILSHASATRMFLRKGMSQGLSVQRVPGPELFIRSRGGTRCKAGRFTRPSRERSDIQT